MGKKGKRPDGDGSLYQRESDGLWMGSVTFPEGKRRYVSSKKQSVALGKLNALKAERDRGLAADSGKSIVSRYLDSWLDDSVQNNVRPRTFENYALNVRRVEPHIGKIRLRELRPAHLQTMYGALLKQGLSARSVEQCHTVLHRALKQAVLWNLIPQNPADAVCPPRPRFREMETLTTGQVQKLFNVTADDRLHALWVLFATTGLRSGEALGLKWDDIDFDGARLWVRRALQRQKGKGLVFTGVKTHRSIRPVHLNPNTVTALRKHRARQLEERLATGRDDDEGLVFTNRTGGKLDPGNVLESFQRRLKNAGLPKRRVHDMRHTAATLHMNAGTNPKVVQELLGHSTITITLQTYSHVMDSLHVEAAKKMDAFFAGIEEANEKALV